MKRLTILCLLPLQLFSQNITGVWSGTIQTMGYDLPYELVISDNGGTLGGYSLIIFPIDGIENVGVKSIKLKNRRGEVFIEDEKLVYDTYTKPSKRVKLFATLTLKVRDTIMLLIGTFRTRSLDFREQENTTFAGTIRLRKESDSSQTKLVNALEEMNLFSSLTFNPPDRTVVEPARKDIAVRTAPKPAADNEDKTTNPPVPAPAKKRKKKEAVAEKKVEPVVAEKKKPEPVAPDVAAAELATRKTEIIQNVFFNSDSLVLRLYDHGVVDGDTVSVVLNGKVIAAKQRLSGKPIVTVIHVTPELGDSLQLIMYAENLGTIPPNTGLLTVQDGDTRYEIRFEGTKQKSSAIVLRRKPKNKR